MDVEKIFRKFTNGSRNDAVRAGWVERYMESPITFWCSLHAPQDAKEPMTDFGDTNLTGCTCKMFRKGVRAILIHAGYIKRAFALFKSGCNSLGEATPVIFLNTKTIHHNRDRMFLILF